LELDAGNAPETLGFPDTFISTKPPTQNAHVVTKAYADALRPPSINNGAFNSVELSNIGTVLFNANGHTEHTTFAPNATHVTEQISKRRKKIQTSVVGGPTDVFVKNVTNSKGLMLSSGYNDGFGVDGSTFPYVGVFSELDNEITPMIQLNADDMVPVFLTRAFKSVYTAPALCTDEEILTKKQIIDLIGAGSR
jgi:hypothetical protein